MNKMRNSCSMILTNHRHVFAIFNSFYLFTVLFDVFERFRIVNCEHAQKTLAGPHVLISHSTVLFLAGRVQNIQQARFAVDDHLFPVRVLDCRIIFVYETLIKLTREKKNKTQHKLTY